MVEIVVALIMAVATITAAIIQYCATVRVTRKKPDQPVTSKKANIDSFVTGRRLGPQNHVYWFIFGSLLTVVVLFFGAVEPDLAAILNAFVIIPLSSILLAVIFPIRPAYSSLIVTIATIGSYVGYMMSGELYMAYGASDLPLVLLVYVATVVIVFVVDLFRYRSTQG